MVPAEVFGVDLGSTEESQGATVACLRGGDVMDRRGEACAVECGAKIGEVDGWVDCGEEFVVFAFAGGLGVERWVAAGFGPGDFAGVERDADAGGFGNSGGVAAQAVAEVDEGVEIGAQDVGEGGGFADAGLEAQVFAGVERSADSACDEDAVALLGAGAGHAPPNGVGSAQDGDSEDQGAGSGK